MNPDRHNITQDQINSIPSMNKRKLHCNQIFSYNHNFIVWKNGNDNSRTFYILPPNKRISFLCCQKVSREKAQRKRCFTLHLIPISIVYIENHHKNQEKNVLSESIEPLTPSPAFYSKDLLEIITMCWVFSSNHSDKWSYYVSYWNHRKLHMDGQQESLWIEL